MVLTQLSKRITDAINKMKKATILNKSVLKKMISEITMALLYADVSAKLIQGLQINLEKKINPR